MAMKVDVSLCLLVIPIVLSLLLSSHHFSKADNEISKPLITTTCNHTEFSELCISTLESDSRSFSANLTDLSRIALDLAVTRANETRAESFKLVHNSTNYENWAYWLDCFDIYNLSFYQFKESPILRWE